MSELTPERCPRCGCDKQLDLSVVVRGRDWGVLYYCGTIYWPSRDEVTREGVACRQLTQAQELLQQALAREAWLRRVLEQVEWEQSPANCPICDGYKSHGHAPDCELAAALSSAQANPYAAVVEAARKLAVAAEQVVKAWDMDDDVSDAIEELREAALDYAASEEGRE